MEAANLLIRFLLELCALVALGFSGYHAPLPEAGKIALAIAAPLALAVLWSLFAAHKARVHGMPWTPVQVSTGRSAGVARMRNRVGAAGTRFLYSTLRFPPSRGVKALLGFLLLEAAAASLVLVGEPVLAGVFAVVIAVNCGLIYRLDYQ